MVDLIFATHNENKAREIRQMIPNTFRLKTLLDIGQTEEIVEDGETIEENSLIKANYVYKHFGLSCFADDTGLEVDSLNGAPGVISARYAGTHRNSEENMNLLLKNLESHEDRSARFKTIITLITNDGKKRVFEGIVDGRIGMDKRGEKGFGYDPIFIPEGHSRTFAEMNAEEKNSLSHRARAFEKLVAYLKQSSAR